MLRLSILCGSVFLVACSTTRTSALVVDESVMAVVPTPSAAPQPDMVELAPAAAPAETTLVAPEFVMPPARAFEDQSLYSSRFTIKGGYWGASEDSLDDGYIVNVSWMKYLSRLLAVELEIGYVDVDGDDAGTDLEVWSVPIMLNGRLNVPVWILEAYGGLGIGTLYYDAEATGAISADDDGFLLGGNAFIGAGLNLADRISLGLEAKYYVTEDVDDVDEGLDAFAVMLTLGFSN